MPNWCLNYCTITHPDPQKMKWLGKRYLPETTKLGERFFERIHPTPPEQEIKHLTTKSAGGWYHWRLDNWGCKWDASQFNTISCNLTMAIFQFMTPWSPPTGVYDKLAKLGFTVTARYFEPGMAFGGFYNASPNAPPEDIEVTDVFDSPINPQLNETFDIESYIDSDEDEEAKE